MADKPELKLGQATNISAPKDLLGKARSLYQAYVPNSIQDAVENTLKVGQVMGLNDPATAYGGPQAASLTMLLKDPRLPQEVKAGLEEMIRVAPNLAKRGRVSRFTSDPFMEGWSQRQTGVYKPPSDELVVTVNKATGVPRQPKEILSDIWHETKHRRDTLKARLGHKLMEHLNDLKKQNANLPYSERPVEKAAERSAKLGERFLTKKGKL